MVFITQFICSMYKYFLILRPLKTGYFRSRHRIGPGMIIPGRIKKISWPRSGEPYLGEWFRTTGTTLTWNRKILRPGLEHMPVRIATIYVSDYRILPIILEILHLQRLQEERCPRRPFFPKTCTGRVFRLTGIVLSKADR
jgi:hypothetical protein